MSGEKPRFELSPAQVVGGALAAASAAVAASVLGVAGTVIGAVVASVVTTVGSAMYTHSMRRGRVALQRVRTTHLTHVGRLRVAKPKAEQGRDADADRSESTERDETVRNDAAAAAGTADEPAGDDGTGRSGWRERFRGLNPRTVAISAACALLLALGVITGVEALIGKPISSALGGGDGGQKGTSIGALAERGHKPAPTKSRTPRHSPTPTATTTLTRTPTTTAPTTRAPLRQPSVPPTSRPASTSRTSHAPTPAPTTSSNAPRQTRPGGDVAP